MDEDASGHTTSERSDYLLRHLTLRQLQIFAAIVRHNSYTRAAEELFLTQPTVSMQIKKLHDVVGLPLFEHVERKSRPTEIGEALFDSCEKIFDALNELEQFTTAYKGLQRGRLRLSVITTAKYFSPEILGAFCNLYPEIDVSLKVANRSRILERMQQAADDLYVLGSVPEEGNWNAIPFAPNPLVVVAKKQHPLTRERHISIERLAEEPWIVREMGSGIRDMVTAMFRDRGLQPKIRMELGSNEAIKHAVVGGLGLSLLSLHTLTLEGATGPVDVLEVEGFPVHRQWYLVFPKEREVSLITRTFIEFVQQHKTNIQQQVDKVLADFELIHQERWRSLGIK